VRPPVEAELLEHPLRELLHRVGLPGGHDVVVRLVLLEHEPHGLHVVAREAPVALGVEVAEPQLLLEPRLDPGGAVGDLAGHELQPAPGRLVVEEYPRDRVDAVALPVVDRNPVPVDLGDPVGAPRVERGLLRLRRLLHLPEHLARGGLVEADLRIDDPYRLEDPRHAEGGDLAGEDRLRPGGGDERLRPEVVDLGRPGLLEGADERVLVDQVGRDQAHPLLQQVLDALGGDGAAPPLDAVDAVPLLEEKLRQVRSVLPRDAGDQCGLHRRVEMLLSGANPAAANLPAPSSTPSHPHSSRLNA